MRIGDIRLVLAMVFVPLFASAQDGHDAYDFLRLPASSRVNALGGHSVSLVENDPSLSFHNPALLGGEMDGKACLNYMNYVGGISVVSAIYTKAFGERSAWGAGATYINYGSMKETSTENVVLGTFSVQDIGLHAFYEYDLSDRWRGGLSLKALYSTLADYYSFGLAVDAGLSYFDAENDLAIGVALKNIGAQLKSYYEERQSVPWDLQIGMTRRLAHAPLRLSVTAMYLNRWKFDYVENTDIKTDDSFVTTAFKHLVLGLEFVPSDNFWLGVGFNPKRRMDMKLTSGNGLGGFSFGGGVRVSRFDVSASIARFHPSAMSMMIGISMKI
ncbi:MAG: type IX secretion system protein PorQ [Tannerella sp.]|jgi:hypothetical protein|nr:type IX secretion system protein PorQ [Tannerella sp.]